MYVYFVITRYLIEFNVKHFQFFFFFQKYVQVITDVDENMQFSFHIPRSRCNSGCVPKRDTFIIKSVVYWINKQNH